MFSDPYGYRLDDTIAAISSPAGRGARAIVRLSGPAAVSLAQRVFVPCEGSLSEMGGFHAAEGLVRVALPSSSSGMLEFPSRAYVFRSPRSYTRQDVVEVHLPGGAVPCRMVLESLLAAGARQAEPGEFTLRAFLHGRIDLSQAEAVADVIHAADESRLRASLWALNGEIHRRTSRAADVVAETLAVVEASIDLAEEHLPITPPGDLAQTLQDEAERLRRLAESALYLPDVAEMPTVVLAGRPNVGKSSLLNALTGSDRAITSDRAGTTRDVLRAELELPGGAVVHLLDAAGFGDTGDPLCRHADAAARAAVARADAICLLSDTDEDSADEQSLLVDLRRTNPSAPILHLRSKCDLSAAAPYRAALLPVSARTGEGLDALRQRLAELLHLHVNRSADALGLHDRQRRCLLSAADACLAAAELLQEAKEAADVAELAAVELREALRHLGGISGQIVTEDVLGRIFARFCVGK